MNKKRLLIIIIVLVVSAFIFWNGWTSKNDNTFNAENDAVVVTVKRQIKQTEKEQLRQALIEKEEQSEQELTEQPEPEQEPVQQEEQEWQETVAEEQAEEYTYGDAGRLVIPDVGVSVPLNWSGDDEDLNQYLVDLEDSASFFDYRNDGDWSLGIADHNNQGFDGLYYVVPGTIAYIMHSDGTKETLECVYKDGNATSDGYHITDSMGRNVSCINPDYIYMYTCNQEGWWSVTVTLWQYVW